MTNETRIATKGELENFLAHLIDQLDACGFLRNLPKRPGMVRNIRHFFQRGEVTEQELRTLHGIVTELAIGRRQMGRLENADPATERSAATERTAADPGPALPGHRANR
jgi:tRNA C32,U32 (ribose-2'-O)-methylase TrmJ